ncbi:MAG: hypothetical protein AAF697_00180 [Pseudomonadota bacterium]
MMGTEGLKKIAEYADPETKGLYLLFAHGKRPDRSALKAFAASQSATALSHDPSSEPIVKLAVADHASEPVAAPGDQVQVNHIWLELLRDGLAFDLTGLAPGDPAAMPEVKHRFDLDHLPDASRYEALCLSPGHHLAGGERTMPVAKGLVALGRDLMLCFEEMEAILWPPAMSVIGRRYFESTSSSWLEGGPFPALGLTAFEETPDGALQSVGLEFWIGQELLIEPPLSADKVAATRMGVRLVNQLILVGGIEDAERLVSPDGTRLLLRQSRNGHYIRVSRE